MAISDFRYWIKGQLSFNQSNVYSENLQKILSKYKNTGIYILKCSSSWYYTPLKYGLVHKSEKTID